MSSDRQHMTADRAAHLIRQVATLTTLDEAHSFRAVIQEYEIMGAELFGVLRDRIDYLAKREGKL